MKKRLRFILLLLLLSNVLLSSAQIIKCAKYEYITENIKYTLTYKALPIFEGNDQLMFSGEICEELQLAYNDSVYTLNEETARHYTRLLKEAFIDSNIIINERTDVKSSSAPIINVSIGYGQRILSSECIEKQQTIYLHPDNKYSVKFEALREYVNEISAPYIYATDGIYHPGYLHEQASYKDGMPELLTYIVKNFKWPSILQENAIVGKIIVEFVITDTGSIGKINIRRTPAKELGDELTRVLETLPKGCFNPGKIYGKPVSSWFVMPIEINSRAVSSGWR